MGNSYLIRGVAIHLGHHRLITADPVGCAQLIPPSPFPLFSGLTMGVRRVLFDDDNVAVPIIDRIIHHWHIFMLGGESDRLKQKMTA